MIFSRAHSFTHGHKANKMNAVKSIIKTRLLVIWAMSMSLSAQVMSTVATGSQAVYFNIGLDPALLVTSGYARGIEVMNRDAMLSAELAIPIAEFDLKDYRLKVGGQTSLIQFKGWDIAAGASFIIRGTVNWMHSATNIGTDITGWIGRYGKWWFGAIEIGWDKALATKITATDRYKRYYFTDFKDGWYGNPGGNFTTGLRVGFMRTPIEITLRAGLTKTQKFNDPFNPLFGVLGVNYRF